MLTGTDGAGTACGTSNRGTRHRKDFFRHGLSKDEGGISMAPKRMPLIFTGGTIAMGAVPVPRLSGPKAWIKRIPALGLKRDIGEI